LIEKSNVFTFTEMKPVSRKMCC